MTNITTKSVRPILIDCDIHNPLRIDENGILAFEPNIVGLHYSGLSHTYKELILISLDDNLKDGDPCLVDGGLGRIGVDTYSEYVKYSVNPKKVIAVQSQIPDDYIQQFIEEYGLGDVKDVEIECWDNSDYNPSMFPDIRPKITDNFITFAHKK